MQTQFFLLLALLLTLAIDFSRYRVTDAACPAQRFSTGSFEHPPPERFSYMCSIRPTSNRRRHVCGGILIHPQWVLTAAHCVDPYITPTAGALPFMYCGIYDVEEEEDANIFYATGTCFPEEWRGNVGEGHDVALLKLDREADFPVPKIAAEMDRPSDGDCLGGLGWGETGNGTVITKLQYASKLEVKSDETCGEQWQENFHPSIMMCAGVAGVDACDGDSGGPLLKVDVHDRRGYTEGAPDNDVIHGIISFGEDTCGKNTIAGVYTFVGYYQEWILAVIEASASEPLPVCDVPVRTPGDGDDDETPMEPKRGRDESFNLTVWSVQHEEYLILGEVVLKDVIKDIENDNATAVRAAVEQGLDPTSRYNDSSVNEGDADDSLLHWAIRYRSTNSARVLVEAGAELEARNTFGNTPLHYCSIFNSESIAEILLENGADVDADGNDGFTPIHYAARDGRLDVARVLIKNGADVNIADDSGETPLHIAAWKGHTNVVKELLEEGADVNAATDSGETPLHYAAKYGHLEVVEVLVEAGASKRTRDNRGNRPSSVVCTRADPECTSSTESAIEDLVSL